MKTEELAELLILTSAKHNNFVLDQCEIMRNDLADYMGIIAQWHEDRTPRRATSIRSRRNVNY